MVLAVCNFNAKRTNVTLLLMYVLLYIPFMEEDGIVASIYSILCNLKKTPGYPKLKKTLGEKTPGCSRPWRKLKIVKRYLGLVLDDLLLEDPGNVDVVEGLGEGFLHQMQLLLLPIQYFFPIVIVQWAGRLKLAGSKKIFAKSI